MSAHRYWRILVLRNAGDGSFTQFAEVEMRIAAGGADQCNGGTAACSSGLQAGSAAGIFANDGTTTFAQWNGTGAGQWCSYDFGAGNEKDIVEVAIMGAVGAANRAPGQFFVQYSDDNATWVNAWEVSYSGGYVTGTNVVFTKPTGSAFRYWRTRFEGISSAFTVFSIAKMTMASVLGGADQCTSGAALSFSVNGANVAANAFDANTATFYASNGSSNIEYLGYDFGSGVTKTIVELSLLPRQDITNFKQWPRTLYVAGSPDGINWLPIWTVANTLNTYSDGAYVFRNPAAISSGTTHRWWGIRPTALQSGAAFGVREVEFRASIGGADLTTGGVGGAWRPNDNSLRGPNAFDSTTLEYGSEGTVGLSDLVAYDYGHGNEKAAPAQVAITARGASPTFDQSPTAFDVVWSDDGHNWTTQASFTTPATWTSAETRTFNLPVTTTARRRLMIVG